MLSPEKIAEVHQLAARGLNASEIARRTGVSRSTVSHRLANPDPHPKRPCIACGESFQPTHGKQQCCSEECRLANDRERRRRAADGARAECIDCGKPLSEGSRWRGVERCKEHHLAQKRAAAVERYDRIEALYAEGLRLREIAERLGSTKESIGVSLARMRAEGRSLPYRNAGYDRTAEEAAP